MPGQSLRHDSTLRCWNSQRFARGWWHSFELPDGTRIEGVLDVVDLKGRLSQFPIPEDLQGKRVLDIGTWDGWFAFEMERRGADVLAIDCWDNPLFREVHARLQSRVDYRQIDMYDLTPDRVGRFDIVLFMGVLYHLKHPLLALERVCALTTDIAAVDSYILGEQHGPGKSAGTRVVMEFYETDELGGQTDNWVAPSLDCLLAFCRTAGFARVELRSVTEYGAAVACYRRWLSPRANAAPGPQLVEARHNVNGGINFLSSADDYVSVWFNADAQRLTLDDVQPEVNGYGVRPFHLSSTAERNWQANFKLPPGLLPGWQDVTVRVAGSYPSNPKQIAVDMPINAPGLSVTGLCDGTTWIAGQLDRAEGQTLSLWIAGLPENADHNNVRVSLGGRRLGITYIETEKAGDARQVNVEVPHDSPPGTMRIEVAVNEFHTEPIDLLII